MRGGRGPRSSGMKRVGQVLTGAGGVYRVRTEEGDDVEAVLRGRLKKGKAREALVVAGDRVRLSRVADGPDTVEEVLPRETELVRRAGVGRHPKVVAANVEQALVVVSVKDPPFSSPLVDRFLAVVESNRLECVLVVNKTDLGEPEDVDARTAVYRDIGYRVRPVSARTGAGLDVIRELLNGRLSVLVGPSGVGKSSLLNALDPDLELRVREVSSRKGRGRHTTVRARIVDLAFGGQVVDTPGFSSVGLWGMEPQALDSCFPELRDLKDDCKFRSCLHRSEPACAVLSAVEEGAVDRGRYESYLRILQELEEAE